MTGTLPFSLEVEAVYGDGSMRMFVCQSSPDIDSVRRTCLLAAEKALDRTNWPTDPAPDNAPRADDIAASLRAGQTVRVNYPNGHESITLTPRKIPA